MKLSTGKGSHLALIIFCLSLLLPQVTKADPARDYDSAVDAIFDRHSDNSDKLNRWFTFYSQGKLAAADKVWSGILKDYEKRQGIGDFLENVNERSWFGEGSKQVNAERAYLHLFESTQKILGKEHRFVADIASFLSTYSESKHEYKKTLEYRLLELKLYEKAFGTNSHPALNARQKTGHLLILMKNYREAEMCLKKTIMLAEKSSDRDIARKATHDYVNMLRATGRDTEARKYLAN